MGIPDGRMVVMLTAFTDPDIKAVIAGGQPQAVLRLQ
jgi:hypothetical protein